MSPREFDDLILQVFESSPDKFFFPIVSQQQAKAFVKALHYKGLGYNNICDEINESNERFSTWRRSLSCNKIGQQIIKRINQPLLQLLEELPNINIEYEALFEIEQNVSLFDKQNIKKKSRLWRILRSKNLRADPNDLKKILYSSMQNNSIAKTVSLKVKHGDVSSVLPETSKNIYNSDHVDCGEDDQISIVNVYDAKIIKLKTSNNFGENCDVKSPVLQLHESPVRPSSDISSSEEQFFDCDCFKSCSSAFINNSQGCILQSINHKTIFDQSLESTIEIPNSLSSYRLETYNSDLDISCYEDIPPNVSKIEQFLKTLESFKRSASGFLYVFCDNVCPNMWLFKIGVSRKPYKKLSQAQVFNTRLTLLNTIKVSDMGEALKRARLKLNRWKVDGHLDWFRGNEELLHELKEFMKLSMMSITLDIAYDFR